MDLKNGKQHTENGEAELRQADRCQYNRGTEEAANGETLPQLAAYRDATLSTEAANQLVRLAEDKSHPAYAGEDLPLADKTALLRKAASTQKNR